MENLYTRIERLCKLKGINVTQMCKDAGINRANLSDLKYERSRDLSTKTLQNIAMYFGVDIDYLVNGEKETTQVLPRLENLSDSTIEILRYVTRLSEAKQAAALRIIKAAIDLDNEAG